MSPFLRNIDIFTTLMYTYYINSKRMIFCVDMQWESYSKFNLEQRSLSISWANIGSFANIQGTQVSFATAELAIFAPDMLWVSWSKFYL